MIRGAIDNVTAELVQGWIFTEHVSVRDLVILAFSGRTCIGSGRANLFRQDLADAGLADGYLGFSFPISVSEHFVDSVVIRVDGCDAVLLQSGAQVGTAGARSTELNPAALLENLRRLQWALKRGRISQQDFDFLRSLWTTGVYERGLVRRKNADDRVVLDPWRLVARGLFEAYAALDLKVSTHTINDTEDMTKVLNQISAGSACLPIAALHSAGIANIRVFEGSHVKEIGADESEKLALRPLDFVLAPENLVIVDARTKIELSINEGMQIDLVSAEIVGDV